MAFSRTMLEKLVTLGADPSADEELLRAVATHTERVRGSARRGDRGLVALAEAAVRRDHGALAEETDGSFTLRFGEHVHAAGRFETPSIDTLRARARAANISDKQEKARARLWVLVGAGPATDIGSLQANADDDALFQVASQFNCLEAPGPFVTEVTRYLSDPTQGPRASVSALPATLLRHYKAPGEGGERFEQKTDARQLDLLADVCEPHVARVQNGYLSGGNVTDPKAFVAALDERFGAIRVGVHDGAEVVLGYDWDGSVEQPAPKIAQVFTSTVAGGGYGGERLGAHFEPTCRALLRAAYLGTLLAAASLGKRKVVLTLIGGGVFGNPAPLIWDAIVWAIEEAEPQLTRDLDVIVNGRDLDRRIEREALLAPVRERGGAMFVLGARSGDVIVR